MCFIVEKYDMIENKVKLFATVQQVCAFAALIVRKLRLEGKNTSARLIRIGFCM